MAIRTWDDIQKEMEGVMLNTFSLVKLKPLLIEFYLNMYKTSENFLLFQSFLKWFSIQIGYWKLGIGLSLLVAFNHILL